MMKRIKQRFSLPSAKTKPTERQRWIKTITNTVPDSKDTSICEKHWPTNYETVSVNSKLRPRDPPSIFPVRVLFRLHQASHG